MFDLEKYEEWLELTVGGYKLKKDAPDEIKEEIIKINESYARIGRGDYLIVLEPC